MTRSKMPRPAFGPDRQYRFFEALERGESIAAACRYAPVAADTCYRWLRRVRDGLATPEQLVFAWRFERATATDDASSSGPLSEPALVALLEEEARDGSVTAIRLLLERPWERRAAAPQEPPAPSSGSSVIDELAAQRRARPA